MDQESIRLLLVEDNPADVLFFEELMTEADPARFSLTTVERLTTGLDRLAQGGFAVTLLDLSLPDSQGMETLLRLRAIMPEMPVVVLTGLNDEMLGVQLIQAGAQDYLVKGQVNGPLLLRSILYAIERKRVREELQARAHQQAAVAELGQRALASGEQASLLDEAAVLVAQTLEVPYSQVLELLPERDTLCLRAGAGWPAGLVGLATLEAQTDSHLGYTLMFSEPVIVEDFQTETRFNEGAWLRDYGVVSGMSVVIEGQAFPFGILGVYTSQQRRFTEDDIHFLQAIAHVLAAAIEHQRTQKALQTSVQQLEMAYRQATIYAQELKAEVLERKQAEQALAEERTLLAQRVAERTAELSIANAELARAARLKDEFLANMSHELRTPLNAILGLGEALLRQNVGPLNERQINALQTIDESGHHLLALINDILDVSKIEAGKLELQLGPVSVEEICQVSLQFVRQIALKKRIDVAFQMNQAPPMIQADARRLKQILVNLLSNAVKFTPMGGQVGLEITTESAQDVIHFTVWDTGIGISDEDLARLFKPFVQLDSGLSRQYEGTGLGLALVSRLAKLHQGSVSVTSDGVSGRGSRFTISLPSRGKAYQQLEPSEAVVVASLPPQDLSIADPSGAATASTDYRSRLESPLILLAEDNEANIRFLTESLTDEGYRLVIARNGLEAIEQVREAQPALILMDIQMPGMEGLEATRRIRAETHLAEIPIIALTALAMPGDRERCLAAGANDYISKPFRMKALVSLIETHLNPAQR